MAIYVAVCIYIGYHNGERKDANTISTAGTVSATPPVKVILHTRRMIHVVGFRSYVGWRTGIMHNILHCILN